MPKDIVIELPAVLALGILPESWTLGTTYLVCAALSGSVLGIQLILGLFGFDGHDGDVDVDHDFDAGGHGLPLLSLRAISCSLLMFGLVGLAGLDSGWGGSASFVIATLSGTTVLFLVAWALKMQTKLESSGSEDAANAVGSIGRVYLRIPERNSGRGKVTVEIQGRTAEYDAFTEGDAISTGARVRIVRLAAPAFFEVAPADEAPQ